MVIHNSECSYRKKKIIPNLGGHLEVRDLGQELQIGGNSRYISGD